MYRNKKDVVIHVENLLSKLSAKEFKSRAYSVARLYFEVGDYPNCQKYVEQYLTQKDNNAAAYKLLGQALQKMGLKEKALEQYKASLDIDPAQTSTILDICELLADDEVIIEPGRAKYWCEKAEATFPTHPVTFRLRERLIAVSNPDPEALVHLLRSELTIRPKDAVLHARLLKHYHNINKVKEAFEHACNVEFGGKTFINNYGWFEILNDLLKHNSHNTSDWLYQLRVIESVSKVGAFTGLGEFHNALLQHHRGQDAFHAATFLLKKAKKDQMSWRDATKVAAPLMLVAWQTLPLDTIVNWLRNALEKQKIAVNRWYLEGTYRCSQAGHYLLSNIQEKNQSFLDQVSQCATLTANQQICKKDSYLTNDRPPTLPVNITDLLCSLTQMKWWDCAYKFSQNELGTELIDIRATLSRGIEVVRCIDNHGLDPELLCTLGRIFSERAKMSTNVDEKAQLEIRAGLYYSSVVPLPEKLRSKIVVKILDKRMFDYTHKDLGTKELNALLEECKLYVAVNHFSEGEYDKVIEIHTNLKSPQALYHLTTYKKIASEENNMSRDPETKPKYAALLSKAKMFAYKALDRLRDSESNKNHPLYSDTQELIEDIETHMHNLDSDFTAVTNDGDGRYSSDENVSAESELPIRGNHIFRNISSTPKAVNNTNATNYRTAMNSQILENSRVDQQFLGRIENDIKNLQKRDNTIGDFMDQTRNWFDENRKLSNQIISTIQSNMQNTTDQLKLLKISVDQVKDQIDECRNEFKDVSELKKQVTELKKEVGKLKKAVAPTLSSLPTVPGVSSVAVPPPVTSVTMSKATSMEPKDAAKSLPVNVVITSSDPLPTYTTAPAPILSVTIPPKHIKGTPHNYQIQLPQTTDSKVAPPVFVFPAQNNKTSTTNPVSNWNQSSVFKTTPVSSTSTFSSLLNPTAASPKLGSDSFDTSKSVVDGPLFGGYSPNTSLNKSRTLSERSNISVDNYDPCPDFKPIVPLPAEVKVTTGEEDESVIFSARAKLFRFVDKQWKERGLGEMKLLKHKTTGKVRVLMRREQVHKICANHIITAEMEIKQMMNETKAYFWVANDFADETVVLEKFCIRFKTADIAQDFYNAFEKARQGSSLNKTLSPVAPKSEELKLVAPKITSSQLTAPNTGVIAQSTPTKAVVGGFTFSSTPTFKPVSDDVKPDTVSKELATSKPNVFSGLSFKTTTSSPFTNLFGSTPSTHAKSTNNDSQASESTKLNTSDQVEEYEPNVEFKPVVPLLALVDQKTGEEDETILFEHRAKLLRFDPATKEWKERGLGNIKLLVHKDNIQKVRLLMRREQIMKVCCNHAVTNEMVFQKMPNLLKAVTWCAKDFSEGKLVAETFCLRFKTIQLCDEFIEAVKSAQSKMKDESKAAKEEKNAAKQNNQTGFGEKFKPKAGSWHCDACYTNNLESFAKCACCETPKPNSSGTSSIPAICTNTITEVIPVTHVGWGDKFKPKPGIWECKDCLVRNEPTLENCSACNSPKDPTKAKTSIKLTSDNAPKFNFGIPPKATTNEEKSASVFQVTTQGESAGSGPDLFKPTAPTSEVNNNPSIFGTGSLGPQFRFGIPPAANDQKSNTVTSSSFDGTGAQKFSFGVPSNNLETSASPVAFGTQKPIANSSVFDALKTTTESHVIDFSFKKNEELSTPVKPALLPILSVTIPPKHIKGTPHNYQIQLPQTTDSKVAPPVFVFPAQNNKTSTTNPVSNWNQSSVFKTTPVSSTSTFSSLLNPTAASPKLGGDSFDTSKSVVDGPLFGGYSPNTSLNKSRTAERSNTSVDNYDPCLDFKPIVPLPAEVKVTTGEEDESVIFSARAKLFRFVDKQWKERGLGEMKLLKHKTTGKVRVLMRREQVHKICANHIITAEMEIKQMMNETKAYFWVANDFADETVVLEKFCIRFKTADIAQDFYNAFEKARQGSSLNKTLSPVAPKSEELKLVAPKITSSQLTAPNTGVIAQSTPTKAVVGGFTFSSTPTFKPVSDDVKPDTVSKELATSKPNVFSGLSFKTTTSSPFTNLFGSTPSTHAKSTNNDSQASESTKLNTSDQVEEYEPNVEFKPVVPLPALVDQKTGEEDETILFEHRAKLLRFDPATKEWKERGLGNIKLLVHKDNIQKVRLLMRREQIMKVCCNHAVTNEMVFQKMPNLLKAVTWCAKDFSEGKLVAETFCLRFKTIQLCDEFIEAVKSAQSKMKDESKAAKEEKNAAKQNNETGFGEKFKPKAGSWHCDACYTNNLESFAKCACCETPKPNSSGTSFIPAICTNTTTEVIPVTHVGWGDKFKPKPGSWECKDCLVRNEPTLENCSACNSPKDPTKAKTSIKLTSDNAPKFNFGIPPKATTNEEKSASVFQVTTQGEPAGSGPDLFKPTAPTSEVNNNPSIFGTGSLGPQFRFGIPPAANDQKSNKVTSSIFDGTGAHKFSFGVPSNNLETSASPVAFGAQKPTANSSVFDALKTTTESHVIDFSFKKNEELSSPVKPALLSTPQTDSSSNVSFGFKESGTFDFVFKPKTPTKGKSPAKSPHSQGDGDESDGNEYAAEDKCYHPFTTPVIPLPDKVEVVTGEENETELYGQLAKLYRFSSGEWKERGKGIVKILKHKETGKLRVVMRREQVLKICLNHALTPEIIYNLKDEKSWQFIVNDFSEGELNLEHFCLRFKSKEVASEFKESIDNALQGKLVKKKQEDKKEKDDIDDVVFVSEIQATTEEKQKAKDLMLPENFFTYKTKEPCQECRGCHDSDESSACGTDSQTSSSDTTVTLTSESNVTTVEQKPMSVAATLKASLANSITPVQTTTPLFQSPTNSMYGTPCNFEKTVDTSVFRTPLGSLASNAKTPTSASSQSSFGSNTTNKENTFIQKSSIFSGFGEQTMLFGTPQNKSASIFGSGDSQGVSGAKSSLLAPPKLSNLNISSENKLESYSNFGAAPTKFVFSDTKQTTPTTNITTDKGISFNRSVLEFPVANTKTENQNSSVKSIFGEDNKSENLFTNANQGSIFGPGALSNSQSKIGTGIFGSAGMSAFGSMSSQNSLFGGGKSTFGTSNYASALDTAASTEQKKEDSIAVNAGGDHKSKETVADQTTKETVADQQSEKEAPFSVDNSLSFAALSTGTGPGFAIKTIQKQSDFKWEGAGQQLSVAKPGNHSGDKSKNENGDGEDTAGTEEEYDPHYEPIVPLPDKIVVTTGEEDEEKIYGERCKLYRYDEKSREWKERGVGEMKILFHGERKTYRLLLRREQVHKAVLNMLLYMDLQLLPMKNSDRAWTLAGRNFAENSVGEQETLAVRFKTVDQATAFHDKIVECVREKIYGERCKLYRYDEKSQEWKERGVGEMKILFHGERKTYQLLLHREQVHKAVLNMLLYMDLQLLPMKNSDRAWTLAGRNFAENSVGEQETLAVRFKTVDQATAFYDKIVECVRKLQASSAQATKEEKEAEAETAVDNTVSKLRLPKHLEESARADNAMTAAVNTAAEVFQRASMIASAQEAAGSTGDDTGSSVNEVFKQVHFQESEEDHEHDGYYNEDEEESAAYYTCNGEVIVRQGAHESNCANAHIQVLFDQDIYSPKILVTDAATGEILADMLIYTDTEFTMSGDTCVWSGTDYTSNDPVDKAVTVNFYDSETAMQFYDSCETSKAATYASTDPES